MQKTINELLEFGILNIDKPENMTSFDVADYVKKKLKLRKTSHFGTLDPMVTGVLPIALNRAVKLTGFFIGEDKTYMGIMKIHKDISIEHIQKVIDEKFIGKIMQKPPVKSRVKRETRQREIKSFRLLAQKGRDITFIVECQGGTYIRKLISDLGESMNVGMNMSQLRRIRAGIFEIEKSIPLSELENIDEKRLREIIIPAQEAIKKVYPTIEVKREDVPRLLHGAPLGYDCLVKKSNQERNKIVAVFSEEKFVGMYKVTNEKNIFAKPEFVLQEINK